MLFRSKHSRRVHGDTKDTKERKEGKEQSRDGLHESNMTHEGRGGRRTRHSVVECGGEAAAFAWVWSDYVSDMFQAGTSVLPTFNAGTAIRQSVGTNLTATVTVPIGTNCLGVRARVRIQNGSGSHFEFSPAAWVMMTR